MKFGGFEPWIVTTTMPPSSRAPTAVTTFGAGVCAAARPASKAAVRRGMTRMVRSDLDIFREDSTRSWATKKRSEVVECRRAPYSAESAPSRRRASPTR